MKPLRSGPFVALVVIAAGVVGSACDITPPAATANGTTISVGTLNTELATLENSTAGACLLQVEEPQLAAASVQGSGGEGTYTMAYTNAVLESQVGELLAEQFARSRGLTVTDADLSSARTDFISTLNGEISAAVSNSAQSGSLSACETASGSGISASALLAALPASIAAGQVLNQAYDEKLLADGADLSAAAVLAYYNANRADFTVDCVSRIVTATEAQANQVVAQLNAGASFAALAKASSIDAQTAANGGSLGCTYTQAAVLQNLGISTIVVGRPTAPIQSGSDWYVYVVPSQTLEPLSAAGSVVRRELLQSTPNVDRVSKEIVAFARHSEVSVDPQYGTWNRLNIVAPVAPKPEYLVSGSYGSTAPLLGGITGTGTSTGTGASTGVGGG